MFFRYLVVCLITGSLFFSNELLLQAESLNSNPRDKEIQLKKGEVLNVKDPELERRTNAIGKKIIDADFHNKIDRELKKAGYRRHTFTGEFSPSIQNLFIEVVKPKTEKEDVTIQRIRNIVNQIAEENNLGEWKTEVTFHK
ncbi:hypothetical protein [Bacillus sp. CHD6a]|uniref:hypothetical protein n=1 Tax=Bacillus sp. CHD6a TaxID=1643452 RepID=UPI0006CD08C7|nr:hypothetical protein [Bacillus sp. CHD6a]KPB06376.1 hypothetical protein AAV98_00835 [Bacillus sp. CHD6a]